MANWKPPSPEKLARTRAWYDDAIKRVDLVEPLYPHLLVRLIRRRCRCSAHKARNVIVYGEGKAWVWRAGMWWRLDESSQEK